MGVKYKYPGESEVVLTSANNYSIDQLTDIQTSFYRLLGKYTKVETGEIKAFFSSILVPDTGISGIGNLSVIVIPGTKRFLDDGSFYYLNHLFKINHPNYPDLLGILRTDGEFSQVKTWWENALLNGYPSDATIVNQFGGSGGLTESVVTTRYDRQYPNEPYTKIHSNPQLTNWYLRQVNSTNQYRLNIIFNGTVIFSRTESYQPEYVQLFNAECSPNTCPVKCGLDICCYDSNGIAVNSFLRSESIY